MKKNQEIQNIKTTKIYTVIITNCSDCHIKLKQSFAKWNNNFFAANTSSRMQLYSTYMIQSIS